MLIVDIDRWVPRIGNNNQCCTSFRLSIATARESRNKAIFNIRIEAGFQMSTVVYGTKDTKTQSLCAYSKKHIMKKLVNCRSFMVLCLCSHDNKNFCYSSNRVSSFHFWETNISGLDRIERRSLSWYGSSLCYAYKFRIQVIPSVQDVTEMFTLILNLTNVTMMQGIYSTETYVCWFYVRSCLNWVGCT
jgi:hypothetical protein